MTRVTGKFQITLPRRLVDAFGIQVGDEVHLVAAGDAIRIVPANAVQAGLSMQERLRLFDEATRRVNASGRSPIPSGETDRLSGATDRDWTREELYTRGRTR